MESLKNVLFWIFAPRYANWKKSGSSGRTPWMSIVSQAVLRVLLFGAALWLFYIGNWIGALILIAALLLMALSSSGVYALAKSRRERDLE